MKEKERERRRDVARSCRPYASSFATQMRGTLETLFNESLAPSIGADNNAAAERIPRRRGTASVSMIRSVQRSKGGVSSPR